MRLRMPSRRLPSDDNLIPMINVVFLLLIFFMVAGAIEPLTPVDATPPESSAGQPVADELVLHVGRDGNMALGDVPVTLDALPVALAQFDDGAGDTALTTIAVRADGAVEMDRLRELITQLQRAGVKQLDVMTNRIPSRQR